MASAAAPQSVSSCCGIQGYRSRSPPPAPRAEFVSDTLRFVLRRLRRLLGWRDRALLKATLLRRRRRGSELPFQFVAEMVSLNGPGELLLQLRRERHRLEVRPAEAGSIGCRQGDDARCPGLIADQRAFAEVVARAEVT